MALVQYKKCARAFRNSTDDQGTSGYAPLRRNSKPDFALANPKRMGDKRFE